MSARLHLRGEAEGGIGVSHWTLAFNCFLIHLFITCWITGGLFLQQEGGRGHECLSLPCQILYFRVPLIFLSSNHRPKSQLFSVPFVYSIVWFSLEALEPQSYLGVCGLLRLLGFHPSTSNALYCIH